MNRFKKAIIQTQAVDVTNWEVDPEASPYSEGAREKALLYSPELVENDYDFLISQHPYLFKQSNTRYPEEFWVEILAYRLGIFMNVSVPPAFASYNKKTGISGALIEWFLDPENIVNESIQNKFEYSGGDLCKQILPDFSSRKGIQHSFEIIEKIFNDIFKNSPGLEDWKESWAKVLVFDALIGNTDRHQNNWKILPARYSSKDQITSDESSKEKKQVPLRMELAFDNGSSMGRERFYEQFRFWDEKKIKEYILKGTHHMTWRINPLRKKPKGEKHLLLLQKIIDKYPETRKTMLYTLEKVNSSIFEEILDTLAKIDNIPTRLSIERAEFMLKLLKIRHNILLSEL